ncbi:MAG: DUF4492 domain-containing protein [Marinilabiliaceae bacterium]|nr:DUF4492 domain-containing protein [Marinilabiliaceae bacterium]
MMELLRNIFRFYKEGFSGMTWGRSLWILIMVKLVFLFLIMRLFFFRPAMEGLSEDEKVEVVVERLTAP